MESIIKQVIESEYRAQKIIEEVQAERIQSDELLDSQLKKMKEEILLSTRQKIEKVRAEKLEQARIQAEGAISEADNKAAIMLQKFELNREQWAKQLLNRILEGDGD